MAMTTLGEAIDLLKEAEIFKMNKREVVIDSLIVAKDGHMTREWMDKFKDLFL